MMKNIVEDRRRSVPMSMSLPPQKHVQLTRNETINRSPVSRKSRAHVSLPLAAARWLGSRKKSTKSSNEENPNSENIWMTEERCMDYGKPPPIEEPHCYSVCTSESSISEDSEGEVTRETINRILADHTRHIGGRTQLLEDMETGKMTTENADRIFASCRAGERNALLLQACFLARDDLIQGLLSLGAEANHSEEERGLTSLDLCAYSDCLIGIRCLISHGAFLTPIRLRTALRYAALGNSSAVVRYFLELGTNDCQVSRETRETELWETVLQAAARANALDVLKLIAGRCRRESLNRLDSSGYGAIHRAADRGGDGACLAVLIDAGAEVDSRTRKGGESASHLAASAGCTENLEILLKNGADANVRNDRGQTPLHLASRAHSIECVEALLRNGRAEANAQDNDGRTPLHLALGRSLLAYDVTEFLTNWRADVNRADKYGYTPLHVAALNELSRCVDLLIEHGADLSARTNGGTSALSIILRKTPTSLNVFKNRLDSSVTLRQRCSPAGEMELRLDFHPLLQHRPRAEGEIGYLGTFVKEGYKEILEHPLCQSFLHLKWQKIRKYYVARLFFYLLYVLVLTGWVMTALAHNCYNESHGQFAENGSLALCGNSSGIKGFFHRHPVVLEVEWYALVLLTILEGIRKAAAIFTYPSARHFFAQPENIVEWCVILSVFATSFVYTGRTYTWQSHVGAFAVLCGWSNLMLMIGQLPMFGAYVAMFTSVQAQVFKLLLAYACLLVGFTASFCVIFPRSKSFSSPHTGLIKVLVMMTGELDFEELFFPGEEETVATTTPTTAAAAASSSSSSSSSSSALPPRHTEAQGSTSWILLQVSAQLSFVLFLLFVTIVLMNLLVGIAVHDIKGLQKTAGLAKLVRQTKLVCDVESALLLALLPNKLMKLVRWTTLVLPPSPLRAVLTVRPLNPRENRLPRDVLAAAYRVAREGKFTTNGGGFAASSSKVINGNVAYAHRKSHTGSAAAAAYPTIRRMENNKMTTIDDDVFNYDSYEKFRLRNEIANLTKICEENTKLIRDLAIALASDNRFNQRSEETTEDHP